MNRILIAGTHSGCGKTTVTCGVLAALKGRGLSPAAFKCGPDYIDPMFHRRVIGVPSYNLDPFFFTEEQLKGRIVKSGGGISLLEGVMGYYDGIGPKGCCSTYQVARATQTPTVLIIDAKGMYTSAAAVLRGFLDYQTPSGIQGVIFNNTSSIVYEGLSSLVEEMGIKPLGFLPREPNAVFASRHLGLVTAGELAHIEEKLALLGELAERYIDLDSLIRLAANAPVLNTNPPDIRPLGRVRLAVARDDAFCFLYEENLEILTSLGAEIVFFSPISDARLPEDIGGLYLGGGYPELHLEALSGNSPMLQDIKAAVWGGMPTIAECGGFLYLHHTLEGFPMAGVIDAKAYRTRKLSRFGYITLQAKVDNLLCAAGENILAHEFHYYQSTDGGAGFVAEKPQPQGSWPCVHATETLYAGFPHLFFEANLAFAENFVRKAIEYDVGRSS